MKVATRVHVSSTLLVLFCLEVGIFLTGESVTYSQSNPFRQRLRSQIALRQVVVVTVDIVLVSHYGLFDLRYLVVVNILDQQVQCIKDFQGYILIVVRVFIGIGSAPSVGWSTIQGQIMFFDGLEIQWFVMTTKRLESGPSRGLSSSLCIQIGLVRMCYLCPEVVLLVFQLVDQILNLRSDTFVFNFFGQSSTMTLDSIIIGVLLISNFYFLLKFFGVSTPIDGYMPSYYYIDCCMSLCVHF